MNQPSANPSSLSDVNMPNFWLAHTQMLLNSYHRWLGKELLPRNGTDPKQAVALFEAPFVVVSHGTQADPILNYANRVALNLWEFDIATLLETPSRLTAEAMHRDERAELLKRTADNGYVDDYRGIRISRSGRRFLIEQATVWNLFDIGGRYCGQAATFSAWRPLSTATDVD